MIGSLPTISGGLSAGNGREYAGGGSPWGLLVVVAVCWLWRGGEGWVIVGGVWI